MTSETIQITMSDGTTEAYVSRPDEAGDHPGVLLLPDAIGLRPQIEQMADRLAAWGYVVLAPHLFYRDGSAAELAPQGDLREPGEREAFFAEAMPRIVAYTPEQSDADVRTFVETLLGLPGVAGGRLGVTGYCMGGRLGVRAAGLLPDAIAAVGAFHPPALATDGDDSPHLLAARGTAEILVGHADADGSNPPEAIAAFEGAMRDAGVVLTSNVYSGAAHGFTMADTSMYDAAGAERHFTELEALFARTLR